MNVLQQQAVNLIVAKLMKECGWEQDGLYYWTETSGTRLTLNTVFQREPAGIVYTDDDNIVFAPTVPEIAEKLPKGFSVTKGVNNLYIGINTFNSKSYMETVSSKIANAYGKLWILLNSKLENKQYDK